MAIGGYSWQDRDEDYYVDTGMNFDGERWFTVRLQVDSGDVTRISSAAPHIIVPYKLVESKLALLKVAPVGAKIEGVGWRRTESIFYLRIYEDDLPLGEWK